MQNAGMIYGYAHVSTDAQDLTNQLALLKAAGCEKIFREKITGTTADRPRLQKLMKALAPGGHDRNFFSPLSASMLSSRISSGSIDGRHVTAG